MVSLQQEMLMFSNISNILKALSTEVWADTKEQRDGTPADVQTGESWTDCGIIRHPHLVDNHRHRRSIRTTGAALFGTFFMDDFPQNKGAKSLQIQFLIILVVC